jgi:crotonobetainyl-CoA:carnitine CoA-transferase CaiB-like acyl-CoA transferase
LRRGSWRTSGARVIKIERPGRGDFRARVRHDGQRSVELFRLAQSIEGVLTLDVKRPGGAEILGKLLARADMFVQNVGRAPRSARHGAGRLRARYPR